MSIFSKKKWNSIEQNIEQKAVFSKLLNSPNKIELQVNGTYYVVYLLRVDDTLVFSQIDPLYINSELILNKEYKFRIDSLIDCTIYQFEFYTRFSATEENTSFLLFEYPKKLRQLKEELTIFPTESDNVKIAFKLKNLPYYKKIKEINKEYMYFDGEFQHLINEYNGKTIYEIELYFPFDKLKVAAVFNHVKKNIYSFKDFMTSSLSLNAYQKYAEDYYKRLKNISDYKEKKVETSTKKKEHFSINDIKIVVCDSKDAVNDYIYQYLKNRISNEILLFNDFESLISTINPETPTIFVSEAQFLNISNQDIMKSISEKYQDMKFALIFMAQKFHQDQGNETEKWIKKPVNGEILLDIIHQLFQTILKE